MLKQKLIKKRKDQGLSQEEMAHELRMEQSQYSRRENGKTVISTKEWIEMAKILNTTVEGIYEPQDGIHVIMHQNEENALTIQNEYVMEIQKKYIAKLEDENARLREEIGIIKA